MNQKKCKRIRKAIRVMGYEKAPLIMKYTKAIRKPLGGKTIEYPLPMTFKYPADSFQRVWKDYKAGAKTSFNRS
jgi:hypothetical protein